jgi:hypothetical protein
MTAGLNDSLVSSSSCSIQPECTHQASRVNPADFFLHSSSGNLPVSGGSSGAAAAAAAAAAAHEESSILAAATAAVRAGQLAPISPRAAPCVADDVHCSTGAASSTAFTAMSSPAGGGVALMRGSDCPDIIANTVLKTQQAVPAHGQLLPVLLHHEMLRQQSRRSSPGGT